MTLKLFTAAAGIVLFALVSCGGNNNADYVDKSLITPGSEKKDTVPAAINQPGAVMPNTVPTNIPGISTVNPVMPTSPVSFMPQNNDMQITPATTTAATTTAPGMNPPHGQPGHRCEISVGAPLDSKPAPANVQPAPTTVSAQPTTVNAQPNPVTIKEVPNPTKTAPGMNPPHGEPGHKCEIAVGAPLDSKPTTTTPTPANAPPLIMAPVKKDSNKN